VSNQIVLGYFATENGGKATTGHQKGFLVRVAAWNRAAAGNLSREKCVWRRAHYGTTLSARST